MRARVYDSDTKTYYLSEVYGEVIWEGYHYSIVENPKAEEFTLQVAAYMDFSVQPYFCNIEMIDAYVDKRRMPWRQWENLDALNRILEEMYGRTGITFFCGYDCFLSHVEATAGLLADGETLGASFGLSRFISYMEGWNYLENEQDIAKLMKEFSGFHDSVIRDFRYLSGDYVKDGFMVCVPSCQKTVQILFDSDWNPPVELVFEAPRLVQLVPPGENYLGDLYDASFFIRDCMIYFYDSYLEEIPKTYDGTFVRAMGARWRQDSSKIADRNRRKSDICVAASQKVAQKWRWI